MKRASLAWTALAAVLSASPVVAQNISMNTAMVSTQNPGQAETFNQQGSVGEIFAAQKQMTYHIMRKMGVEPESLPPEIRAEIARPQTTSVAALESFSAGIDALDKGNFADAKLAFSQAAAADPGFGMAKSMQAAMPEINADDMVREVKAETKTQVKAEKKAAKPASGGNAKNNPAKSSDSKAKNNTKNDDKASKGKMLVKRVTAKAAAKADDVTRTVTSRGNNTNTGAGIETFAAPQETGTDDGFGGQSILADGSFADDNGENLADTGDNTTDLTSDQSVVDTYASGEQQNLVTGGTYSGTTTPSYKIGGLAMSYIHITNDATFIPNNPHYSDELQVLGNLSSSDFVFSQPATLKHSGYANGYIKYATSGNMTGFADMNDTDTHFYNNSLNTPQTYSQRTKYNLANGEFVETGYVTTADFATIDGTPYNYLFGSMDTVSGVVVTDTKLSELATSNANYHYSGSIYATIAEYNTASKSKIGQESGSSTFTGQVDFGAMKLTALSGTVQTSSYKVNVSLSNDSINATTGTFTVNDTMQFNSGYSHTTYGANQAYLKGNIFGSQGDGIGGVFAVKSNGPTDIQFVTSGSFAGKKDSGS